MKDGRCVSFQFTIFHVADGDFSISTIEGLRKKWSCNICATLTVWIIKFAALSGFFPGHVHFIFAKLITLPCNEFHFWIQLRFQFTKPTRILFPNWKLPFLDWNREKFQCHRNWELCRRRWINNSVRFLPWNWIYRALIFRDEKDLSLDGTAILYII